MYSSLNNKVDPTAINQINREYQIYFLFVSFLISLQLICNTIEPVILTFGSFKIPASAIFYVLSFAICDLITEIFGFKLAVRATVSNVLSQIVFCGIAVLVFALPIKYHAANSDHTLLSIFHFLSFELLSSIISLLIAMITNDYIINKLKLIFLGKGFWWRTIVSTIIGEIVMLNIDYNITFYGKKNILEIQHLIFDAMIYKTFAAFILAMPIAILSKYLSSIVYFLKPSMNTKTYLISDFKNAFLFK